MAIDGYVARRTNGTRAYDRDGAFAAAGTASRPLLDAMLDNPYFAAAPPKSTGRERFGEAFLARYGPLLDVLTLEDAVATLTSLTAETVAAAIVAHGPRGARIIVSGGGRHNAALMRELAARVPASAVVGSETLGVDPDAKEALAFAMLGDAVLRGVRAGLPAVTGARHPALLGAIAPDART
jgi:anhydro-N-acetylmuramic acid kinase